jgi:hypothetical protein
MDVLWYGPFDSAEECSQIEVCIGGGPALVLEPFLTQRGKYMGMVTWNVKRPPAHKAWVRLKPNADLSATPKTITIYNQEPEWNK